MEPVITESGREADETDSVKVCMCYYSPYAFFFFSPQYVNVLAFCLSCSSVSVTIPVWVCLCAFVRFVCFPIAPYLMRCKSSVKVAQLAWFIYASPSPPPSAPPVLWCLEWVLMFHDLHCIPFVCGWVLIWNCLLSFYCCIDVPTPLSSTFKSWLCVWVCVCAHTLWRCFFLFIHVSEFFTNILSVCVFEFLSFADPQSPAK